MHAVRAPSCAPKHSRAAARGSSKTKSCVPSKSRPADFRPADSLKCSHSSQAAPPESASRTDRRATLTALTAFSATCLLSKQSSAYLIEESVSQRVFEKAAGAVVSITNNKRQGAEVVEEAAGSGFVWDKRGYIVTNYHCVQQPLSDVSGTQFTLVRLGDSGREYEVEYVGNDPSHDLAVLKIEAASERLQPIQESGWLSPELHTPVALTYGPSVAISRGTQAQVGTSGDLRVGQSVFAIGNPFGLSKTLTAGVVSGLNRGIPTPGGAIATRCIQTDAAVSSGNSGGALLDSSGRLVGISTATFSSNKSMGRGSGVNFAISVDVIREIVPKLIVYGTASGKGVSARRA